MDLIRLNKYLSMRGVASRREADRLIADGQVSVNGKVVTEMGVKIDPEKDKVTFSSELLERGEELVYLMLHKPAGYVTSVKPTRLEPKVVTQLIDTEERVYPVGRLDKETTGLLLFTNDGTLTNKLIHPSSESEKEYEVTVEGEVRRGQLAKLEAGVKLHGQKTKKTQVRKIAPNKLRIILTEGKNRQVRRVCKKVGLPVVALKRLRIKGLELGDLEEGKWRYLTYDEVKMLKS